ncbi:MAG: cytochrome-c peroxidase [Saprospiraceae bacterium]
MKTKLSLFGVCLFIIVGFYVGDRYNLLYPDYFPAPAYDFTKNGLTKEKIALGRALFYEPKLSKDNTISCASCHSPYNGFAHTDHDLSHGINDQIGTRNAPALFNLAWQKSFMWDGAINHLDMQALAPISHPKEMNESIASIVQKLQTEAKYPPFFLRAFGDSVITGEYILKSLSQFQLTLVSAGAKYDQVKNGTADFSLQEANGYRLFQANCNSCHVEPLFSSYDFASNGLAIDTTLNDFGKSTISKKATDQLLFKIPSLRNLSYTYPYMHDGRFRKLRAVLKHYTEEIVPHDNLAPSLQKGITLRAREQTDLIAFLLTLNDQEFVFNAEHQFPKTFFFSKEGFED